MNLLTRRALTATPIVVALTLAMTIGASAQVASLISPDESPEPETEAATLIEFEDREEAMLAYAQCMRDNDIDMDDPVAGEPGGRRFFGAGPGQPGAIDRQSEEFQAAQQACVAILEAARPEIDPAAEQERLEQELALAECLRQNGYPDYPDPAIGADGRLERGGRQFQELGIDRRSEEFQNARMTCADVLGVEQFGPAGGFGLGRGRD